MPSIDQRPARLDIFCAEGDDLTVTLSVTESGSPWVSTGATVVTDIIDRAGTVQGTDFTTAVSTGSLTLTLTDTQTTELGAGQYRYRVTVTKSGVSRTWIAGAFTVAPTSGTGTSSASATLSISTDTVALSFTSLVAPDAANISVADSAGYYTGSTVETVLAEVSERIAIQYNQLPSLSTSGAVMAPVGSQTILTIPTPDATGVLVHPSVVCVDKGWNGYRYWMAMTPFNGGSSSLENPCIVASNNGTTWAVPAGVSNPIEAKPAGASDYNSDTHLMLASDGYMYCFWRAVMPSQVGSEERIYYRRSIDGITWADKTLIISNDASTRALVSPAVIEEPDGTFSMYAINTVPSPNTLVRLTAPALSGTWSAPSTCSGMSVPAGRDLWHLDAHRIGNEYVILINDTALGSSVAGNLYRGVSQNGTAFTQDAITFPGMLTSGGEQGRNYRTAFTPCTIDGALGYEVYYNDTISTARGFVRIANDYRWQDDPGKIAGACFPVYPYVAGDACNRNDSAVTPGTGTSGVAWTVSAGTIGVSSRALYLVAGGNARAWFESGIADGEWGMTIKTAPGSSEQVWLIFRVQDGSNYWRFGRSSGIYWLLELVSGGSVTTSITGAVDTPVPANGDRLRAVCSGNTITCYWNDRVIVTNSSATLNTATKFGFQTNSTATRVTSFYAKV